MTVSSPTSPSSTSPPTTPVPDTPTPLAAVYEALVEPEAFATAWARATPPPEERGLLGLGRSDLPVMAGLLATASLGVGSYAAALHAHDGALALASHGLTAILAAGVAWTAALPTLTVLGALTGSKLPVRSVLFAAMVAVSFGGLAMLASLPVLWFFELCLPYGWARLAVALVTCVGVGVSMKDVFGRVMAALEGPRLLHHAWLLLLTIIGTEMFVVVGLFDLL